MYQDSYAPVKSAPYNFITEQIAVGSIWAYQEESVAGFDFALNVAIEWAEACRSLTAEDRRVTLAAMPHKLAEGPTSRIRSAHEGFDDCYDVERWLPQISRAVDTVCRELLAGHKVLVTCAQGRNRSALVVAESLIALGGEPGATVLLVQAKRPRSLMNHAFKDWLMRDRAAEAAARTVSP